ncbi:MAG: hypothetical protein IPI44_13080 [Sulfuritalea sp.]|nr:hypothetical protein [Sulfuritalea sp.]MBK8118921.1 hypothetical protein [Sulfuritalea sp.]
MLIRNGALQLSVPEQPREQRMPIDGFLRCWPKIRPSAPSASGTCRRSRRRLTVDFGRTAKWSVLARGIPIRKNS